MSDRVAIIDDGELQQIAPPLTCYNEPANLFVAGFIGSPAMNFVDGTVSGSHFEAEELRVDLGSTDVGDATDVTLGVRPEDIHFRAALPDSESLGSVRASVDVLEPIGERMFVYLIPEKAVPTDRETGGEVSQQYLLMTVDPEEDIEEGADVEVTFDRSNVHLFDTATGGALLHGLEDEPAPTP